MVEFSQKRISLMYPSLVIHTYHSPNMSKSLSLQIELESTALFIIVIHGISFLSFYKITIIGSMYTWSYEFKTRTYKTALSWFHYNIPGLCKLIYTELWPFCTPLLESFLKNSKILQLSGAKVPSMQETHIHTHIYISSTAVPFLHAWATRT